MYLLFFFAAMDPTTASGLDPSYVSKEILNAVETKREELILADLQSRIAIILNCVVPSVLYKIMKARARKGQNSKSKNE